MCVWLLLAQKAGPFVCLQAVMLGALGLLALGLYIFIPQKQKRWRCTSHAAHHMLYFY